MELTANLVKIKIDFWDYVFPDECAATVTNEIEVGEKRKSGGRKTISHISTLWL